MDRLYFTNGTIKAYKSQVVGVSAARVPVLCLLIVN